MQIYSWDLPQQQKTIVKLKSRKNKKIFTWKIAIEFFSVWLTVKQTNIYRVYKIKI